MNRISQRHERVEVVRSSVLSTLCNECNMVPASFYHEGRDATLCELCEKQERERAGENTRRKENMQKSLENKDCPDRPSIIPLQDAHVTESIVFDKMDFTTCFAAKKRKSRRSARLILAGLGAQETPESKVDRWLQNKGQAPGWDGNVENGYGASADPIRLPNNLAPFVVPPGPTSGSKRKLDPEPVVVGNPTQRDEASLN